MKKIRCLLIAILFSLLANNCSIPLRHFPGSTELSLQQSLQSSGVTGPASINHIQILTSGSETFQSLNYRLFNAKRSIYVSAYIYHSDFTGARLAKTLMYKARQGLDVRLLLDAWGSLYFKAEMQKDLEDAGVQVLFFREFEILRPYRHLLRNHRRLVLIDDELALTGGFAVQDIWADLPVTRIQDLQAWVRGPLVIEMKSIFARDWCAIQFNPEDPICESNSDSELAVQSIPAPSIAGPSTVQPSPPCNPLGNGCSGLASVVFTSDAENRAANYEFYVRAVSQSQRRVWLVTPYFIPDSQFMSTLTNAVQRNVDVRLIVASGESIQEFPVTYVRNPYLEKLLESGVKVYVYENGFLHSKAAIFDEGLSVLGTSNLDRRSFDYNHEIDIVSYDPRVNDSLETVFRRYFSGSREIGHAEMKSRSLWVRMLEWIWWPLTPQL